MTTYVFHNDKLHGSYDEWQCSSSLPRPSYVYNNNWYIVNAYLTTPINIADVPPLYLKMLQTIQLITQ